MYYIYHMKVSNTCVKCYMSYIYIVYVLSELYAMLPNVCIQLDMYYICHMNVSNNSVCVK